jgi:basic amino acid/polyamine antiporter, APA family
MAEELAFARKASGLVRGLSMMDAFAVGFMNQGLTPGAWVFISLGLATFLGGNLIWATVISVIFAGIGFPLVWGILGGSMPRSGGEYVYNSRILHPIVGIAQSFGDAMIWMIWIFALTPLVVDPGLTMLFQFLGIDASWLTNNFLERFFFTSLFNVVAFCFVLFGIRVFAKAQKGIMFFGLGGAAVIAIVLSVTSRANFAAHWDAWVAKYYSGTEAVAVNYHNFPGAVASYAMANGTDLSKYHNMIPITSNWGDTIGLLVAASWLFAYAYSISFIAGEVKRPDKSIIWANVFAILVPCLFMFWFAIALYHAVGFQFLSASAWNDAVNGNGPIDAAANLPWSTNFIGLAAVTLGTGVFAKIIMAIMALSYIAFGIWLVTLSYLAFPRILFAWGMDRMGPKWFTSITPRFASPVKNIVLAFCIGEVLLAYGAYTNTSSVNIALTGLQITSVFAVTAIAALLFPYVKSAKGIWDSSPYKAWRFLGLPVVVWGAIVNLVYLCILMYGLLPTKLGGLAAGGDWSWPMLAAMVVAWIVGVGWFFFWKSRSKQVGVDVSLTYGELPPD